MTRNKTNPYRTITTRKRPEHFGGAQSAANRYLQGTLPNGLAFARKGGFLITGFATGRLEVMSRAGSSKVLAGSIGGQPIGKVNFAADGRRRVGEPRSSDGVYRVAETQADPILPRARSRLARGALVNARFLDTIPADRGNPAVREAAWRGPR